MDFTTDKATSDEMVAQRLFQTNFAAIHTSSLVHLLLVLDPLYSPHPSSEHGERSQELSVVPRMHRSPSSRSRRTRRIVRLDERRDRQDVASGQLRPRVTTVAYPGSW